MAAMFLVILAAILGFSGCREELSPTAKDIISTEEIVRRTTNQIFSMLHLKRIRHKPKIQKYSLVHNYFMSQTLQDYNSFREITKLTRANKTARHITDFIAALNMIMIDEMGRYISDSYFDVDFEFKTEMYKLAYLRKHYSNSSMYIDIASAVLKILDKDVVKHSSSSKTTASVIKLAVTLANNTDFFNMSSAKLENITNDKSFIKNDIPSSKLSTATKDANNNKTIAHNVESELLNITSISRLNDTKTENKYAIEQTIATKASNFENALFSEKHNNKSNAIIHYIRTANITEVAKEENELTATFKANTKKDINDELNDDGSTSKTAKYVLLHIDVNNKTSEIITTDGYVHRNYNQTFLNSATPAIVRSRVNDTDLSNVTSVTSSSVDVARTTTSDNTTVSPVQSFTKDDYTLPWPSIMSIIDYISGNKDTALSNVTTASPITVCTNVAVADIFPLATSKVDTKLSNDNLSLVSSTSTPRFVNDSASSSASKVNTSSGIYASSSSSSVTALPSGSNVTLSSYWSNMTKDKKRSSKLNSSINPDEYWREEEPITFGTRRIYKGEYKKIKHYPFMASIQLFNQFQCGGSIIASDLVITAASCLQLAWNNRYYRENPMFLAVRVGSAYCSGRGEVITALSVHFHPAYTPKTLKNNLAIIRLRMHINFLRRNRNVKKIALDTLPYPLPVTTDEITILGWGAYGTNNKLGHPFSRKLRVAVLDVYPLMDCTEVYTKQYVDETNFCAGFISMGGGACNRDVGGPGLVGGVLTGVISFGAPVCGTPDAPTVFTKIGYYIDWIEEIMELKVTTGRQPTTLQPRIRLPQKPWDGKHSFIMAPLTTEKIGRWEKKEGDLAIVTAAERTKKPKDKKLFMKLLRTMFNTDEIEEYLDEIRPKGNGRGEVDLKSAMESNKQGTENDAYKALRTNFENFKTKVKESKEKEDDNFIVTPLVEDFHVKPAEEESLAPDLLKDLLVHLDKEAMDKEASEELDVDKFVQKMVDASDGHISESYSDDAEETVKEKSRVMNLEESSCSTDSEERSEETLAIPETRKGLEGPWNSQTSTETEKEDREGPKPEFPELLQDTRKEENFKKTLDDALLTLQVSDNENSGENNKYSKNKVGGRNLASDETAVPVIPDVKKGSVSKDLILDIIRKVIDEEYLSKKTPFRSIDLKK